jgi:hypothetical protein
MPRPALQSPPWVAAEPLLQVRRFLVLAGQGRRGPTQLIPALDPPPAFAGAGATPRGSGGRMDYAVTVSAFSLKSAISLKFMYL